MSSPGENHDSETVTAATLMTAVTTVSTRATRRFPVISVRLTHWLTVRAAARTASRGRDRPAATMMAALYPPTGTSGTRPGQRLAPTVPRRCYRPVRRPAGKVRPPAGKGLAIIALAR